MINSGIFSTLLQVKSGAKNRGILIPAATFGLSGKATDEKAQAFQALYENHHRPVYRLCLRMTQSVDCAEDLTQRVFVRLFKNLKNLREGSDVNTQILHLATDELLCYFLENNERFNQTKYLPRPKVLNNETQKQSAKPAIDRAALECAVAHLPGDYRLIFLLHDFERLTHKEISQILKIDVETSKSNLHEARTILRRQIIK